MVRPDSNSSHPKRRSQDPFIDSPGNVNTSCVDVLKDDLGGTEEQWVDFVEVASGGFEDFKEWIPVS